MIPVRGDLAMGFCARVDEKDFTSSSVVCRFFVGVIIPESGVSGKNGLEVKVSRSGVLGVVDSAVSFFSPDDGLLNG